ncbi:hypothetical protein NJN40_14495 (plasmid) [Lacticaseibacillus paracasei]|uniref:hypothetical protein n=1 Tax=Lacticaseibacillus paracasei TaxID=1597 RepID=UPI0020A1F404|nr:hypothetical protein [Lacticaseibacillus paracasei]UVH25120.1 hypothetical protein NJN40_14495 [Lacticaseibacillus paracasei]
MDEKPIGYLKFNKYVDKLVDNQIWMEKIESFNQRQPRIHNNDHGCKLIPETTFKRGYNE